MKQALGWQIGDRAGLNHRSRRIGRSPAHYLTQALHDLRQEHCREGQHNDRTPARESGIFYAQKMNAHLTTWGGKLSSDMAYPKNRNKPNRPANWVSPAKGVAKPPIDRVCEKCGGDYVGYNGTKYCTDRCVLLAHVRVEGECWLWTGYAPKTGSRAGYGEFDFKSGKRMLAHRASYLLLKGQDPGAKCVCHSCDNPGCINPDHLWLGTRSANMADRQAKERQARGESHSSAKLTEKDVLAIRADPRTNREVALAYGVQENTVSSIRLRKLWGHVAPASTDCHPDTWREAVKATHVRGEKAGRAKLTEDDVRAIRASADGCTKLARRYGVSERSILDITNGKSWKHVT